MTHRLVIPCLLAAFLSGLAAVAPARGADDPAQVGPFKSTDWPWWRGPTRDGVAAVDQKPPVKWSKDQNILWKTPVPGRGHGSAIVVGDQVFIAAAEVPQQRQSLLCFDRATGDLKWSTLVHQGGVNTGGNQKASQASPTPACDGQRIYINFLNRDAIYLTALNLKGEKLWQQKVTDYVLHQGFASSPAIYDKLVIVSADNKGGGIIAGLDRVKGHVVWKRDRPKQPNYASPIILPIAGKDQLIFMGCDLVTSLAPLTGEKIWEIEGSTTECVSSMVTDGKHIFTSGGYPKNHVAAVAADGSGKVVWENGTRVYVPSMLIKGEHLYAVTDAGVAVCWLAKTGEDAWKGRLAGTFSSSPVLVGDLIYATNESGATFIFKANPKDFELVAQNKLGDETFSTPTICGGRIYVRVAEQIEGKRQEFLYCVGEK